MRSLVIIYGYQGDPEIYYHHRMLTPGEDPVKAIGEYFRNYHTPDGFLIVDVTP